uniref:RNA-directed RNA polymerase n=1 Tax=Plasmopara viticola lesion associated mycoophiovirus 1 TaxID=2737679 RepID=A0A6M6ALY3_9VIRU|nr:RNA-dependent RNA polymerase [Plasmopara viticola lesion associated mycoophiovirus 1]
MAQYPVTILEVPLETCAIVDKIRILTKYTPIVRTALGDFTIYNHFCNKQEQLTLREILKVDSKFDGNLTDVLLDKLLIKYKRLSVGATILKNNMFTLRNPTQRVIRKWATFLSQDNTLIPIKVIFRHYTVIPLQLQLPRTKSPSSRQKQITQNNDKDMKSEVRVAEVPSFLKNTIYNMKSCKAWFEDTIIVDVPGDGKCAAHSMYCALHDINIELSFELICDELEKIELTIGLQRPAINSWWSAEALRTFAQQIGVRLLIKDVSLSTTNYWWTTNAVAPTIGLWANGSHFQWCKKLRKSTPSPTRSHPDSNSSPGSQKSSVTFDENSITKSIEANMRKRAYNETISPDEKSNYGYDKDRQYYSDTTQTLNLATLSSEQKKKFDALKFTTTSNMTVPDHFVNFMRDYATNEIDIKYELPKIKNEKRKNDIHTWGQSYHLSVHIPHRMEAPLIRLPDSILEGIVENNLDKMKFVHQHWRDSIQASIASLDEYKQHPLFSNKLLTNDINVLKELCTQVYMTQSKILSDVALECAYDYTNSDGIIVSDMNVDARQYISKLDDVPSFYTVIKTLRHLLVQQMKGNEVTGPNYKFTIDGSGRYVLEGTQSGYHYILLGLGSLFILNHQNMSKMFIGTSTYLDYTITYTEVKMSLGIISHSAEYLWIQPFAKLFLDLSESKYDHNLCVELFKNFEALTLAMSDLVQTTYVNWTPILDTINVCVELCNKIKNENATINDFFHIIYDKSVLDVSNTLFSTLILSLRTLTGNQLQEISSIHKFLFYAEVDQTAGIHKFLKRVHTKRPVNKSFIHKHLWFTRRQFVLSFIKRHKSAPSFLHQTAETEQIAFCIKNNLMKQLESEAIEWWENVVPFNCLSDTAAHNVLEVAKDKGALLPDVKMGPGDSRRELFQVIEATNSDYAEINLKQIRAHSEQSVKNVRSSRIPIPDKYPTRLIPKEKEQKIEARLFGNANLKNKHGLSYKMLKAKHALSYFESEMMTKSDKLRKLLLHNMAQSLNDKDKYSLMLDIEGHNQSMQPDNCTLLYEFVGLLFGETDWGKLATYFSAQTVFMYDEFFDDVIVSRGQLGGIEGWYNPLWTLHTTMLVEMLPYETTVKLDTAGVYSDDVEMIISMEDANANSLNTQFSQIQQYFLKAGMIVRLSQTALSKNRVTLLRNHFFKGKKSDSTIKRILAASMMNNGQFVSEEIEIQGICSTLSSALELSEHVLTSCFVKWYYIALSTLRLFVAYVDRARDDILWTNKYAPTVLKVLLYAERVDKHAVISRNLDAQAETFLYECEKKNKTMDPSLSDARQMAFIHDVLCISPKELIELSRKDLIYKAMKKEKSLRDLLFLILTMPTSTGGKGATLLLNDLLSGHSDGFLKQIHYLHQWLHKNCENKLWIQSIMEYMLRVPDYEIGKHELNELCSNTWPTTKTIRTSSSLITNQITDAMNRMCKNKNIRELLKLERSKTEFHEHLIKTVDKELQPRILQFYAETSVYYLLDLLIRKVETSSGFISKIPGIAGFRRRIGQNELDMLIRTFKSGTGWYPDLAQKSNILEQLVKRRNIMLTREITHNIEEPLYDHIIHPSDGTGNTIVVLPSSIKSYQNGRHVYKAPLYGNEALYKGEIISEDSHFNCIEELLCAKLGAVTKWLLSKNGYNPQTYFEVRPPLYVALCNLSLMTITHHTFSDLFPYLPTNTGGEIFHRLPNMKYKSNSVIRSFPHSINLYVATINQHEINMRGLHDSNIHFDYVTQRMKLKAAFADKYAGYKPIVTSYIIEDDPYIVDVSRWSVIKYVKQLKLKQISYCNVTQQKLNFSRIKQVSFAFLYNEDQLPIVSEQPEQLIEDFIQNEENIIISLLVQYYQELRKNRLTLGMKLDKLNLWVPLIRQLQTQYLMFIDMDDSIILERLRAIANSAKMNFDKFVRSKNPVNLYKEAKFHLNELYSQEMDFIGEFSILIGNVIKDSKEQGDDDKTALFKSNQSSLYFELNENKNNATYAFLYNIIINYCFVLKEHKIPLTIDRNETTTILTKYFEKYIHIMPNPVINLELYYLLWHSVSHEAKVIILDNIYNSLDVELKYVNITAIDMPGVKLKVKDGIAIKSAVHEHKFANDVNFMFERVGLELFYQFDEMKNLMRVAKHACTLYSHPGIFESPTGSEAYTAQYGLFKLLKYTGVIDNNSFVIDLTAGRGDGHLVLSDLNIKHTSYATKDIFTAINYSDDVVFRDDYNVFDPNDLEFCLIGTHIHIDISWIKKNESCAMNIIIFLITHNRSFSIRLNSITFSDIPPTILNLLCTYRYMITMPVSSTLCPYQVYLVGYKSMNGTENKINDIKSTTYYKTLCTTYRELMTYQNLSFAPNIGMQNSVSILLNDDLDSITLCYELLKDTTDNLLKRNAKNAISILETPEYTVMPINYFKQFHNDTNIKLYKTTNNVKFIRKIYNNKTIIGGKSKKKQEFWEQMKADIVSAKLKLGYVELNNDTLSMYMKLKYDCPSANIRGRISSLLDLIDTMKLQLPVTSLEIMNRVTGLLAGNESTFDTTTRTVKDAILLIYFSACLNQYDFGIRFLWIQFRLFKDKHLRTFKLLENYRKLSGLYHKFRSDLINQKRDFKLFNLIRETLIDPIMNNQIVVTQYRKMKAKLQLVSDNEAEPISMEQNNIIFKSIDPEEFTKLLADSFTNTDFTVKMSRADLLPISDDDMELMGGKNMPITEFDASGMLAIEAALAQVDMFSSEIFLTGEFEVEYEDEYLDDDY